MKRVSTALLLSVLGVLCLAGCESGKPVKPAAESGGAAKKQEQPTTAYTGREAFQKMYAAAHMWTPDARPYRVQSEQSKDSTGAGGKAVVWRGGFASPSRRGIKAFLLSGSHSDDAPAYGVSSGTEDTYNPSNSSTQVFDPLYLKIDSDKALEVAQEHGGDKLMKKDPKQPVFYLLNWNPKENALTWHVVYGSSESDAKLRVAVNATTGVFERVEK